MSTFDVGSVRGTLEIDDSSLAPTTQNVLRQLRTFGSSAEQVTGRTGANIGAGLAGALVPFSGSLIRAASQISQFAQDAQTSARAAGTNIDRGLNSGLAGASENLAGLRRDIAAVGNGPDARNAGQNIGDGINNGLAPGLTTAERQVVESTRKMKTSAKEGGEGIGSALSGGLGEIGETLNKIQEKFKSFWSEEGGKAKIAGAAIGAVVGIGIMNNLDIEKGNRKLQAQLGLTTEDAAKYGKMAGQLYASNYGESQEEMSEVLRNVATDIGGLTKYSEDQMKQFAVYATNYATISGEESGRATAVVQDLVKNGMVKSVTEGFDVLTKASQGTSAELQGDLLDIANEYSPVFHSLGLNGSQALGMIAAASKNGAIEMDKVGDSLKEFTLKSTDMSASSVAAYQTIGLNAKDMSDKILSGGEGASQAFQMIVDGLAGIQDPTNQATAAIGLFGTPLEDLGITKIPSFLKALSTGGQALKDFSGTADDVDKTLSGGSLNSLEGMKRAFEGFATSIGTVFAPAVGSIISMAGTLVGAVKPLFDVFTNMPKPVQNIVVGLGAFLLLRGPLMGMFTGIAQKAALATYSLGTAGIAGAASTAIGAISKFATFMAGPWGLAIGLGVTALLAWTSGNKDSEEAVAKNKGLIDALSGTLDTVTGKLTTASAIKIGQDWIQAGVADQFKDIEGGAARAATSIVMGGKAITDTRHDILEAAGGWDVYAKNAGISTVLVNEFSKDADRAGVSSQQLLEATLAGGDAFEQMAQKVLAANLASGKGAQTIGDVKDNLIQVAGAMDPAVKGLETYNAQVKASGEASTMAADSIKLQGDATKTLTDAQTAGGDALAGAKGQQDAYLTHLGAAHDKALQAESAAARYDSTLVDMGNSQDDAKRKTVLLNEAVASFPEPDLTEMQDEIAKVGENADKTSTEVDAFRIAVDKLQGRNVPLAEATKALNDQIRDIGVAFTDATKATDGNFESLINSEAQFKKTGSAIDTTTEAGSKLYDSVSDYSKAYDTSVIAAMDAAGAHATVAEKTKAAKDAADLAYQAFMTQAKGLGISDAAAQTLATNMGILEGEKLTPKELHLTAQDEASGIIDGVDKKIKGMEDKEVTLRVHAVGTINDAAGNATITLNSDGSFRTGNNQTGKADGGMIDAAGHVFGGGTGTSDSVRNVALSVGEGVLTAQGLKKPGNRKAMDFINNGGEIQNLAVGGMVGGKSVNTIETKMYADDNTSSAFTTIQGILDRATSTADTASKEADAAQARENAIPKANSGGTEQWRGLANKVAAAKGEDIASVQVMLNQMSRESSGNPAAINLTDSNAQAGHPSKGLLQFIDGTFAANADPGFSSNIWDPESQMHAWYNYINRNYGGYVSFGQRGYGAYAEGGLVTDGRDGGMINRGTGPKSDDVNIKGSKGEFMVNAASTAKYRDELEFMNADKFANGGPIGVQLSGRTYRDPGTREGNVLSGFASLAEAKKDIVDYYHTLLDSSKDAYRRLLDVSANAKSEAASDAKDITAAQKDVDKAKKGKNKADIAAAESDLLRAQQTQRLHKKINDAQIVSARNYYMAMERQAVTAGKHVAANNKLTKQYEALTVTQKNLSRAYDTTTSRLAANIDKANQMRQDKAQLASGIANTARGYDGGVLGHAEQRTDITAVNQGLAYDVNKIAEFNRNLEKARKNGLSNDLLQQVAQAGVEGGGQQAAIFANASKAQVAYANTMQNKINAYSANTGALVAGAVYDKPIAALDATTKALKALQAQQDAQLNKIGNVLSGELRGWTIKLDPQGLARLVAQGNKLVAKRA